VAGLSVVYGLAPTRSRTTFFEAGYSVLETFFYNCFYKLAWSVSLGWVVFSCVTGYGGMIHVNLRSCEVSNVISFRNNWFISFMGFLSTPCKTHLYGIPYPHGATHNFRFLLNILCRIDKSFDCKISSIKYFRWFEIKGDFFILTFTDWAIFGCSLHHPWLVLCSLSCLWSTFYGTWKVGHAKWVYRWKVTL